MGECTTLYFPVEVCESAPQVAGAYMDIGSQEVRYHCKPGLSFPDGRVSVTVPCPCRQTWNAVLSGLTCTGRNQRMKTSFFLEFNYIWGCQL